MHPSARSVGRSRFGASRVGGVGLAILAVLILLASPLLAGRAHARAEGCGACPPSAAASHGDSTRRPDAACSAACALAGQLLAVRADTPAPQRSTTPAFVPPARELMAAGDGPEQDTPPPR